MEAIEEMCSTEAVYTNFRHSTTQCLDYLKAIVKLAELVDQHADELIEAMCVRCDHYKSIREKRHLGNHKRQRSIIRSKSVHESV